MEFLLQPDVYGTGKSKNLLELLESVWVKSNSIGKGTIYIISGFANYNGGVRFYPVFSEHIRKGGKIVAIFGGSASQRLTSQQVVEALLSCNASVYIINRKRLLHAKCYGLNIEDYQELIVTSGNFTGPGMSQNAEAALKIDNDNLLKINFSWLKYISAIEAQKWDTYKLTATDIIDKKNPGWGLLYDEEHSTVALQDTQLISMVVLLSHSDTARIQAPPGSAAGKGTQYIWLSKGSFDFFPALTEKNKKGIKNTYSCLINLNYIDLKKTEKVRVTFEADNNLDFRLGTAAYRYTQIAKEKDIALITRRSEYDYEIRIISQKSKSYVRLLPYATTFIGHQGKRFGYISNNDIVSMI